MITHKELNQNATLWIFGNAPTQEIFAITYADLVSKTKISVLLTDELVGSASYFAESPRTRRLLHDDDTRILFLKKEISFFIPEQFYDWKEHFVYKTTNSPEDLVCYQNKQLIGECISELSSHLSNNSPRIGYTLSHLNVKLRA